MNANRHTTPRVVLAGLVAVGALCAAGTAPPPSHAPRWPTSWVPAPPPPAVFAEFQLLYAAYSALPSPKFCTFDEWIVRHGVTDPLRRRWMHVLYILMEQRSGG